MIRREGFRMNGKQRLLRTTTMTLNLLAMRNGKERQHEA
jgi:hypothetical protein